MESERAHKIDGAVRKLRAVMEAFDMKGTNRATMLNAINTINALRTRPAPAATDTGLVTVGNITEECLLELKQMLCGEIHPCNDIGDVTDADIELCARSQAEELLAAVTKERDHWKEYSSGQGKLIESGVFVTNDEYVRLTALEAKPTERDELVLYNEACEYNYEDGYPYAYMVPHPNGQYVSRSQAEELLAAERAENDMLKADFNDCNAERQRWKDRAEKAETDNAAQAARIKELEEYAREATKAITGLTGGGSENFGKEIGDVFTADLPYCLDRIRERYVPKVELKRLEAKLAAAEKALEARDALINNLVKHVDALPDDAEFYGLAAMWASRLALMLGEARAALGGKLS